MRASRETASQRSALGRSRCHPGRARRGRTCGGAGARGALQPGLAASPPRASAPGRDSVMRPSAEPEPLQAAARGALGPGGSGRGPRQSCGRRAAPAPGRPCRSRRATSCSKSRSSTRRPTSSARRAPESTSSMIMAVSRRASKSLPAQAANSRRRPHREIGERADPARRAAHLGHRVGGDLAFVLQPGVEHLERPIAVGGGRRLPAGEQVGHERLDVLAPRQLELDARAARNAAAIGGLQVGLDRAVGLVLGRRCSSKERARSGTLGSAMTGRHHVGRQSGGVEALC